MRYIIKNILLLVVLTTLSISQWVQAESLAGTWELEYAIYKNEQGEDYKETVDVTSEARLMGKTYHFNGVIKKDLWIHKGMEDGTLIEEHRRRVQ